MEHNRGAIIRLVDEYLKRQDLTEPRGSGPAAMVNAASYRILRDELIRSGARMPLDELGSGIVHEGVRGDARATRWRNDAGVSTERDAELKIKPVDLRTGGHRRGLGLCSRFASPVLSRSTSAWIDWLRMPCVPRSLTARSIQPA
jgi:hypothetical protein